MSRNKSGLAVMLYDDEYWMQYAIEQAILAQEQDEVPIGAVLVKDNQLIASGFNQPIATIDPSAHAEIVCIRKAASVLNNYRLPDTTLYVSLEPCAMCAGAIIQARIARLVYAASEPKSGAIESVFQLFEQKKLNHSVSSNGGVLAEKSAGILKTFFRNKRLNSNIKS